MNEIFNSYVILKIKHSLNSINSNKFINKYFVYFLKFTSDDFLKTLFTSCYIYHLHSYFKVKYKINHFNLANSTIQILTRRGLKLKSINSLNFVVESLYIIFYKNCINYSQKFQNYKILFNISKLHKIFWNVQFFSQFIEQQFYSLFCLKISKSKTKIKSKKKLENFKIKLKYLNKSKRLNWVVKYLVTSSVWFNSFNFETRLFYSLITSLLNPTENSLYKHRLEIYKLALKLKNTH